jgi:hypothetical protein
MKILPGNVLFLWSYFHFGHLNSASRFPTVFGLTLTTASATRVCLSNADMTSQLQLWHLDEAQQAPKTQGIQVIKIFELTSNYPDHGSAVDLTLPWDLHEIPTRVRLVFLFLLRSLF